MSGDVQPRKRRDKRKKKEEPLEESVHQHHQAVPGHATNNEEINIHVHKETSTGGGFCAKFIFFILTAVIAVIIGLTIIEYNGHTDLKVSQTESTFSRLFEGWFDKPLDDHDYDIIHNVESEISDEHESDENVVSEEIETEQVDEVDDLQVAENNIESNEEEDDIEVEPEDNDEEQREVEDVYKESEQQSDEDDDIFENNSEEEQEISDNEVNDGGDDDDDGDNNYGDNEDDNNYAGSGSNAERKENEQNGNIKHKKHVVGVDESDEKIETGDVGQKEENVNYIRTLKDITNTGDKVNVGDDIEQQIPDLTRRKTIVSPPTLEDIEQDINNVVEDFSDDENDAGDEEEHVQLAKEQYENIRSSYSRSLTPTSEPDDPEPTDAYDYEEKNFSLNKNEEDLSEYEDDEELLKKLEAKYGKLESRHTYDSEKKESEEEEEEEEDDEEEEEEEEEEDGIEDDGQYSSWKRVKSLSDNGADSESDEEDKNLYPKTSGPQSSYEYHNITNTDDYKIKDILDNAQRHLEQSAGVALSLYTEILEKYPNSPRALYGKARALDIWAEKKRSNKYLEESVKFYIQLLNEQNVPDHLFLVAAERCIDRMRFVGQYGRAIVIHKSLMARFPENINFRNQLAVTYLTLNRIPEARLLLLDTLKNWPNDGFALVHYGFILKIADGELIKAVDYLRKGISTKELGVVDGRFYFHLGDALTRLGKIEEAMEVYKDGTENKVFLSIYQRSLYNVDRLTGRPWWDVEQTPYKQFCRLLENKWKDIHNEGLNVLNKRGYFKDESENLKDVGNWKQFELYARGIKNKENCHKCPITCQVIDSLPDARGCKRGQVKFSVMHPGTHVWPHCGPTNCRLRIHLGLKVPKDTYIRVATEARSWEEGKVFIFDDSFEHEVWHNGTTLRLVLIVDVWHPELTNTEKLSLSAI